MEAAAGQKKKLMQCVMKPCAKCKRVTWQKLDNNLLKCLECEAVKPVRSK